MNFHPVVQANGPITIQVSMSVDEALSVYVDMAPTLETSTAYDRLQNTLHQAIREVRRIESL